MWVCSAPLALRGLWSSESYVTSGRLLSPAPCFPRCLPSLVGFLPWLAWVPLPPGRFRSFRSATSLRPGPWLIVSFELVPVVRFGSASELCSRVFRALSVARFHPRYVSAFSPDFCLPLRYLASCAPLNLAVCFSLFAVSTALRFLCTSEVGFPRCYPSGSPSLGFLPFTFLWIQARFRSRLIFVHLKAYELSPVQLLPSLRPTHGSTYRYASKFKVFRICDSFIKDLVPPTEES